VALIVIPWYEPGMRKSAKAVKVAISLPRSLHRAAERERKASRETRSQFFRRAVESLLEKQQELDKDRRYIEGYLKHPETEDEVAVNHQLAIEALAKEPWE
jgi:metal-responsive CopG/Arc/MetJ family transcriptional regulator